MSDGAARPIIFISYSQTDRIWLDYVRSFFKPLAKRYDLLVWDDQRLQIGSNWRSDIYSALDACHVFIVLVSRYSLASDFVLDEEIPRIRARLDGVTLCPIVVTPYYIAKGEFDWLDDTGRRPPGDVALSELSDPQRDREMATITKQVDDILKKLRKPADDMRMTARLALPLSPQDEPSFPSIVDCGRLPEAPYKKLVGREDELRRLDEAWETGETRIVSLVAWGGVGKTSLVSEWLMRVRDDGFRGADAVLCWSFYSQGSSTRRAASGEGFLDWALGKLKVEVGSTSSMAKGERLAEQFSKRRILLVLDGLEPLQFGPEGRRGALKDHGLRTFLRRVAAGSGQGLVVLTSRHAVLDLLKWQDNTSLLMNIGELSPEASTALLKDAGVKGAPAAFGRAVEDFEGHALTLSLLAGYLRRLHGGDIGRHERIRAVNHDPHDGLHDQARRVIEALVEEWLVQQPVLLAIMRMIGLFDRPASVDCVAALRKEPVIDGFNEALVGLDAKEWKNALAELRAVRLLEPEDASAPDALDAHPLVREWFGVWYSRTAGAAWKAAHSRLFDHLRTSTKEGKQPTLEGLAPLYQAIAHGSQAGRYQEAVEVYRDRICRRYPSGSSEFYSMQKLGAFGSDLAAISWFFEGDYGRPLSVLIAPARSWIVSVATACLQALGRPTEALAAQRVGLRMEEAAEDLRNVPVSMANVCIGELAIGQVVAAVATGQRCVVLADEGKRLDATVINRTIYADALLASGQTEDAERTFLEAERRQKQFQPQYPLLYSTQGYSYCDLLLGKGEYDAVKQRASKTLQTAMRQGIIVDVALTTLAMGRASLGATLSSPFHQYRSRKGARDARVQFERAVEGLVRAGIGAHLSRGYLARAVFFRSAGNWREAALDLDEVEEAAQPGSIKLTLCDTALGRARLALAEVEAFAPLSRLLDGTKPVAPDTTTIARRCEEAAAQLAIAADYITSCGYHRRDTELAELQSVLRGERKFADLPPRV